LRTKALAVQHILNLPFLRSKAQETFIAAELSFDAENAPSQLSLTYQSFNQNNQENKHSKTLHSTPSRLHHKKLFSSIKKQSHI